MREDSFVSSTGADQFSENNTLSGSDSETQGPAVSSKDPDMSFQDPAVQLPNSDSEPPLTSVVLPSCDEQPDNQPASEICSNISSGLPSDTATFSAVSEPVHDKHVTVVEQSSNLVQEMKPADSSKEINSISQVHKVPQRSSSILSRKLSSDSLSVSIQFLKTNGF